MISSKTLLGIEPYWILSRKGPHSLTEKISAFQSERGEKDCFREGGEKRIVSDNSKCRRMSERTSEVDFRFCLLGKAWMFSGITNLSCF